MNWKVTYRDREGKRQEEIFKATSRDELFRALSGMGISPIRIEETTEKPIPNSSYSRINAKHLAWAGLVVVAVGLLYLVSVSLRGKEALPPQQERKPTKAIKDVTPAIPRQPERIIGEAPQKVDPSARPSKVGEIVNNYVKLPSGELHYIKGEVTNNVAETSRDWFNVFEHRCENDIACLLTLEPGETLVGTPVYRGRFVKEFLKSLETPIIPSADDPQEIKDLKRMVTEAKIELKAAYDRGEDIEQIMLETRNQMQDLAAYRQALETELFDTIKDNPSPEDVEDFIKAANQMLASKGIAPMELNPLTRKRLQRMIEIKKGQKE